MHLGRFATSLLLAARGSRDETSALAPRADPATPVQGFYYYPTDSMGRCRSDADFKRLFEWAKDLPGTGGKFSSARLYTSIQCKTMKTPNAAFKAAVETGTTLLVGLWASANSTILDFEIEALQTAAKTYGDAFVKLVVGIAVGTEDLYRTSEIMTASCGKTCPPGAASTDVVDYIRRVRSKLAGGPLAGKLIGHVDTAGAWDSESGKKVAAEVDWIGHNSYPYWEGKADNRVEVAGKLFSDAVNATVTKVAGGASGKPVWVTETGWPNRGGSFGKAICSRENAERYWQDVGCKDLFGKRNVWWNMLDDMNPDQSSKKQSFAITHYNSSMPIFNLACTS